MIDYLVWRRDLNPFRFDHYHPYLGPRLAQLLTPPLDPPTNVPVAPEVEAADHAARASGDSPPSVPEPNSLILIGLVSAWGLWKRSRTAAAGEVGGGDLVHSISHFRRTVNFPLDCVL